MDLLCFFLWVHVRVFLFSFSCFPFSRLAAVLGFLFSCCWIRVFFLLLFGVGVLVTDLVCGGPSFSAVVVVCAGNVKLLMPPCNGFGGWFWFSELQRRLWCVLCVSGVFCCILVVVVFLAAADLAAQ